MRILVILSVFLFLTQFLIFLPSQTFAHSTTAIIRMTQNGFEPQTITIDENSTVLFVNQDKVVRWPASDVHPTHDLYPEFDPQKGIEPGQSWPFKPQKIGEWKFHDHLNPHLRGVLKVTAEPGSMSSNQDKNAIISWIQNLKATAINFFTKALNSFGPKLVLDNTKFTTSSSTQQIAMLKKYADQQEAQKVWEFIKQTYKGQSGSSGNIHDLAHLTGSLIFDKKGFEGIRFCSAEFAFGCYHGFLDKAFAKNLDKLLDAQNACLKLGSENSVTGPVASCIHGIGHGVASFHQTSDLKASLSACRKLTSGKEYCFDGVFMEYVRSAPDSAFKYDDPLYPCNALEKQFGPTYSSTCGRNQPSLLMSRFKMGFDEVVGVCGASGSLLFKQACFDSLGFSLAATGDVDKIIAGCRKINAPEFIAGCIKSAAGEFVFQEVPDWQDKSIQVCNGLVDENFHQQCLQNVDRIIKDYGKDSQRKFSSLKSGEDKNSYVRDQMRICFEVGGKDGCYKKVAQLFYDAFGLRKSLDLFKANEDYPEVYARCHETTHYLSRLEYEKQKNIAKVYTQCDSTCHGGCYHGTLEAYLKENSNTDFAKICGKQDDYQKPIEFNECLHGLGHAAMFVTDMELKQSLTMCDKLPQQEHKERCYTGVFMENSSSSTSFDHVSIYIKVDDPFYPCNSLDEKYQSLCWQYQSSYFSIISNQDWVKVADLCLQIPQKYQEKCFRTIGTNQVGFTLSLDKMKQDCDLMPNENFKSICVAGVISSLSYRFVGESQKMIDFCSMVDSNAKESCYKQMGTGLLDWSTDKNLAKTECNKIPDPKGLNWCISVI